MGISAYFDAKRFTQEPLEWLGVASGGPELELCVAARPNLKQAVLAAIVKIEAGDRL